MHLRHTQLSWPHLVLAVGAAVAGICVLGFGLVVATGVDLGSRARTHVEARDPVARWPTWALPSAASVRVPAPSAWRTTGELALLSTAAHPARGKLSRPANAEWTELSLRFVAQQRTVDPPRAARAYALVSVAMYDAVVAAHYWQDRYRAKVAHYPSDESALAEAAAQVLAYLYPEQSRSLLEARVLRDTRIRVARGETSFAAALAGLDLGRAVARVVIAHARADRSDLVWDGRRPHGDAHWSPAPGASALPMEPMAGHWRPWVLRAGSEFRPPPPPRLRSTQFLSEVQDLLYLRAHLAPAEKRVAKFWEGGPGSSLPPGVWNDVALAYVRRDRLDTAHAARVFATLNVAQADAGIAVWDAKFTYWSPRPENAIRSLKLAKGWTPFLATPPFPAYVSAHSGFSAAAANVLAAFFPRDAGTFRQKAEQAGVSRLWGGIHYRSDHVAGMKLGRAVARLVLLRAAVKGTG